MRNGIDYCGDCRHLTHEDGEHGAGYMKCMHEGEKCGRVINYSRIDEFAQTIRPKWCPNTRKDLK